MKSWISLRETCGPQTETKFVQLQNKNGKSLICGVPHVKQFHIQILILKLIKYLFVLRFQPVLLLLGFFNPQPVKSSVKSIQCHILSNITSVSASITPKVIWLPLQKKLQLL